MKNKKKSPNHQSANLPQSKPKHPISTEAKKRVLLLILLSFTSIIIYFAIAPMLHPIAQFTINVAYLAIFGASLVSYIIYNRAFTRKSITVEMLPDTWSTEQKTAYILNGEERLKKSRWLMFIIIPTLVPIGMDALYLFVWEAYLEGIVSQIIGGIA